MPILTLEHTLTEILQVIKRLRMVALHVSGHLRILEVEMGILEGKFWKRSTKFL